MARGLDAELSFGYILHLLVSLQRYTHFEQLTHRSFCWRDPGCETSREWTRTQGRYFYPVQTVWHHKAPNWNFLQPFKILDKPDSFGPTDISIPNFILLAVPATLEPSSLNTMIAFATGGLLGDVFLHLVPHSFFGEGGHEGGDEMVRVEGKRNIVIG